METVFSPGFRIIRPGLQWRCLASAQHPAGEAHYFQWLTSTTISLFRCREGRDRQGVTVSTTKYFDLDIRLRRETTVRLLDKWNQLGNRIRGTPAAFSPNGQYMLWQGKQKQGFCTDLTRNTILCRWMEAAELGIFTWFQNGTEWTSWTWNQQHDSILTHYRLSDIHQGKVAPYQKWILKQRSPKLLDTPWMVSEKLVVADDYGPHWDIGTTLPAQGQERYFSFQRWYLHTPTCFPIPYRLAFSGSKVNSLLLRSYSRKGKCLAVVISLAETKRENGLEFDTELWLFDLERQTGHAIACFARLPDRSMSIPTCLQWNPSGDQLALLYAGEIYTASLP